MNDETQTPSADELRKQGNFDEAIPVYEEAYKNSPSSYSLRWLIYCHRKLGNLDKATEISQFALKKYPEDSYIKSEFAWVTYDRDFRTAKESDDFNALVQVANQVIAIDPENKFLNKIIGTAVMTAGKKQKNVNWSTVARFAVLVDPDSLSDTKRKSEDGKFYMSEKEQWYVTSSKAFLELESFEKAIEVAQAGLQHFSNQIDLTRTIGLAQFAIGDIEASAKTLRPLLTHPRKQWYIFGDLAEVESKLGNKKEAYRLYSQALLAGKEDQFKVSILENFAVLAIEMKKLDEADLAITFSKVIRENQGWPIRASLTELESQLDEVYKESGSSRKTLPTTQKELAKTCRRIWEEAVTEDVEFKRGKVGNVFPDSPFTFIYPEDGSERVYAKVKDLPRDCQIQGVLVEFVPEKSFDHKKKRESVRTTRVRRAN